MEKLISMTDYVLEQKRPTASEDLNEADYYYQECEVLQNICNYANFLKQPLELWMFVPCDENGNILEEPNHLDYKLKNQFNELVFTSQAKQNKYHSDFDKYQQAKDKVLFEFKDFEFEGVSDGVWYFLPKNKDLEPFGIIEGANVEYLIKAFDDVDLTLTQTAKTNLSEYPKQI